MRRLWEAEVTGDGARRSQHVGDSSYIQRRPGRCQSLSLGRLCFCFFSGPTTSVTGTFRLSYSCFHFIRDKSKKTWQMVTVPCLIFKTPPSSYQKRMLPGGATRTLHFQLIIRYSACNLPPLFSFTHRDASTHVYIHIHKVQK